MLSQIGLTVTLTPVAPQQGRATWRQGRNGSIALMALAQNPDPVGILDQYLTGIENPGNKDAALAQELAAARTLAIGDKRTAAFEQLARDIFKANVYAPLCAGIQTYVASSKVTGLDQMPGGHYGQLISPWVLGVTK
jgi:hypothetical protein